MPTVMVLGDGPNEVGREWQELREAGTEPALSTLVHRMLGSPEHLTVQLGLFRRIQHGRGKGAAFPKKTKAAILIAKQKGFHAVVILIDRDRGRTGKQLTSIAEARDEAATAGGPPCAVGQAIETFDAWMIADGKAVRIAGGDASRSHPHPESLNGEEGSGQHPKDRAIELFGSRRVLTERYAVVARNAGIDLLRKLCPRGFAPFAEEIEERVLPVVAAR